MSSEFQLITEALGKVYNTDDNENMGEAYSQNDHPMASMSATKAHKTPTPAEKAKTAKKQRATSAAHSAPAMSGSDWASATGGKYTKECIETVYSMMLEDAELEAISEATGVAVESLNALCARPAFSKTPTGARECHTGKVNPQDAKKKPGHNLYNRDKAGIQKAAARVGIRASYDPTLANEETVLGIAEAFGGDQRELLILGLALIEQAGVPALTEAVSLIYENAGDQGLLG